ncbi:MAG: DUF433 domain-containing protein [Acidobacteriia bacterium]|nr:DUF433 domain-containing protein [Terriglobia bacterium]
MSTSSATYRYIVHSPGVRSGNAIAEGTRIGVHDVIGLLQNGETIDTVRDNCFPTLTKSQVTNASPATKTTVARSTCSLPNKWHRPGLELPALP